MMAEHPNTNIFNRLYNAFSAGNMVKAGEEFADDLVWHIPAGQPMSGDYEGRDATLENFAKVYELTAGTYKFEIFDILPSSKHVAAYVHATGRRNSKTLDQGYMFLFRIRDSKIVEAWEFANDGPAWQEFWS